MGQAVGPPVVSLNPDVGWVAQLLPRTQWPAVATATVTAQDTHGGNLCLLGHPVNGAHGGAGHMGAVAITVVGVGRVHAAAAKQEAAAAADEVTARADPPAEFGVAGAQAGVDHINGDTLDDRIENLRDVTQIENQRAREDRHGRGYTLKA